jgi:hypothetical protein
MILWASSIPLLLFASIISDIGWSKPGQGMIELTATVLGLSAMVLGIAFRLLSGCCKMVFGREFFRRWQYFEIAVGAVPDSPYATAMKTLPPISGSSALRHSIYNHDDCVKAILDWILITNQSTAAGRQTKGVPVQDRPQEAVSAGRSPELDQPPAEA